MKNAKFRTRALTEAAIMVALALVFNTLKDVIPLGQLPNGGSLLNITMVPLVLYGYRYGAGWGALAGFVFGGINYFIGSSSAIDWMTIIFDYFLAFSLLTLGAGLFRGKKNGLYWGTIVGGGLEFLTSYLTGVFLWGKYMPESFLGLAMPNPWVYSLLYNGLWAVPNIALAVAVFYALKKPLKPYLTVE